MTVARARRCVHSKPQPCAHDTPPALPIDVSCRGKKGSIPAPPPTSPAILGLSPAREEGTSALQKLVDLEGTSATSRKSVYPSSIVLSDSLSLIALNIAFHVHPSYSALRSYQTIFPCHEGAFLAIQLPLLG
jgi:hypothetical protein